MDKENNNNCVVDFSIWFFFLKVTQGILYYSSHSETKHWICLIYLYHNASHE